MNETFNVRQLQKGQEYYDPTGDRFLVVGTEDRNYVHIRYNGHTSNDIISTSYEAKIYTKAVPIIIPPNILPWVEIAEGNYPKGVNLLCANFNKSAGMNYLRKGFGVICTNEYHRFYCLGKTDDVLVYGVTHFIDLEKYNL